MVIKKKQKTWKYTDFCESMTRQEIPNYNNISLLNHISTYYGMGNFGLRFYFMMQKSAFVLWSK